MNVKWLKPGAWGFVIGSVVTMIVGFAWAGWMTSSGVERVVSDRTNAAVVAALVPVCLQKSKVDPGAPKILAELKGLSSSWEQRDVVIKGGWATFGGSDEPNRDVAEACASQLVKVAAK